MDDLRIWLIYPLVMTYIAMENGHRNSQFSHKMVTFHSYVKSREGSLKTLTSINIIIHGPPIEKGCDVASPIKKTGAHWPLQLRG